MSLPRIHAGRRRRPVRWLLANGLAQAALALAMAGLLREGLAGAGVGASPYAHAGGLLAVGALLLALRVREAGDAEFLGQDYVLRVRLRILERVAARPLHAGRGGRLGLTMTRLISDLNSLRNWVSVGFARSIVAGVTLLGMLAGLLVVDRRAAAVVGAMVALFGAGTAALTPVLRSRVREARRRRGRLAGNVGEQVLAASTVRHFGRTERELRRVGRQSRRMRDALVRRMRLAQAVRSLPELGLATALAGLVIATGLGAGAGGGETAAAILLLGLAAASLRDLARAWDHRLAFEEGRRRIERLLEGPRLAEARDAKPLPGEGPLAVAFEDVGVGDVLRGVCLEAKPGERVLLRGPSGSGKSTLLALAARLLDPDAGRVRLDGIDVRELALDAVHEAVQLAAPEVPLLSGSVAENLSYGVVDDDDDAFDAVVEACELGEAGPALPEGLDTAVREQGRNLPDGLRARVALARAALAGPRLLLVDDSAFAVDAEARAALDRVLSLLDATVIRVSYEEPPPACDRVWELGG